MSQTITVSELADRLQVDSSLQLIDVRSPGEFAAGHIARAINIPLEELRARAADLGNGTVAILCQSGARAQMACEQLPNSLKVEGGTAAWIREGRPVVRSVSTAWALERQVRLIAGLLVLVGTVGAAAGFSGWLYLSMFVGAGLTFAGITNICGMAVVLAKMPWNRVSN